MTGGNMLVGHDDHEDEDSDDDFDDEDGDGDDDCVDCNLLSLPISSSTSTDPPQIVWLTFAGREECPPCPGSWPSHSRWSLKARPRG